MDGFELWSTEEDPPNLRVVYLGRGGMTDLHERAARCGDGHYVLTDGGGNLLHLAVAQGAVVEVRPAVPDERLPEQSFGPEPLGCAG